MNYEKTKKGSFMKHRVYRVRNHKAHHITSRINVDKNTLNCNKSNVYSSHINRRYRKP